jgi:hypothetical protein
MVGGKKNESCQVSMTRFGAGGALSNTKNAVAIEHFRRFPVELGTRRKVNEKQHKTQLFVYIRKMKI